MGSVSSRDDRDAARRARAKAARRAQRQLSDQQFERLWRDATTAGIARAEAWAATNDHVQEPYPVGVVQVTPGTCPFARWLTRTSLGEALPGHRGVWATMLIGESDSGCELSLGAAAYLQLRASRSRRGSGRREQRTQAEAMSCAPDDEHRASQYLRQAPALARRSARTCR